MIFYDLLEERAKHINSQLVSQQPLSYPCVNAIKAV